MVNSPLFPVPGFVGSAGSGVAGVGLSGSSGLRVLRGYHLPLT